MGCKSKDCKKPGYFKPWNVHQPLDETGMVQFFYHSPSSTLPIRDVLGEMKRGMKTEPHIEIGAENYWARCYPRNIKKLAEGNEKYLFLVTTCRNKTIKEHYGNQYIVGYIIKKEFMDRGGFYCVKGPTRLFSFNNSVKVTELFPQNFDQVRFSHNPNVNKSKTQKILKRFKYKRNILKQCVQEIKRVDTANNTCMRIQGNKCYYANECLRWA